MSYSAGEANILTIIQAIGSLSSNGYTADNACRGNWGIRNKGQADHYCILRPGPWTVSHNPGADYYTWHTLASVWRRYKDDGTTDTELQADVRKLLNGLETHRTMGDGTGKEFDFAVTGGTDARVDDQNAPQWLVQEITIEWKEEQDVTYVD